MMLLVMMLTTTTVWAKDVNLVASPAEDVNLVASPAEGGTIKFASDQDHNHLVVTPNPGFYIENVIHEYSVEGSTNSREVFIDQITNNYEIVSSNGGTVTAYFNSTIKDVRVSFDLNGRPNAANAPVFQDLQFGKKVTRPTSDPTDNGYVFVGWYMDAACTTPYNFDTPLNISLNYIFFNENRFYLTLYARWAKENCTVTFKANGGTGTMDAVTKAGGTEFEIPSCGFSFDGDHPYEGWATSALGEVVYHPGDKITLIDDLTLYAKWSYQQTEFTLNGLKYESNNETSPTVSLIGYDGSQPTGDLVIPGSVTYGGTEYTVTTIGNSVFWDCTGLASVTIPASVTTIGEGAFIFCTGLMSVTIFAPSLKNYEGFVFVDNAEDRKIYVPSGSVDTYKDGWSDYASDIEPLHYIIDEGKDVSILSDGTGQNVALKRSFAKGKKQTVCLPYAPAELLNYGKVWAFTGINEGKAEMTEITDPASLQANTPYIFEASNDLLNITFPWVDISIGSDPKTAPSGAGFTFHGTYAEKTWEATSDEVTQGKIYGFMAQDNDGQTVGQFVKARRKTILRPFSCWLEYTGTGDLTDTNPTSQAAARRTTRGEGETLPDVIDIVWVSALGSTTGIHAADAVTTQHNDAWYSLDGRRLSGEPSVKGVYINNGRKVVIK